NPSALLTQAYRGVGLFDKPLPVRIVAVYPSWDRFVFMVHPRTGIRSLADIKTKRYPLRVSVREDPTHSTLVLIDQAFALHGFALKDLESWGGRLVLCGGPSDARRLQPLARGELDAVFDEGIKVWLDEAIAAGLTPIELAAAEFEAMGKLGWRKVVLPKARFSGLARDVDTLDFSGWPIYASASLPEETAYDICGALAAREAEVPWEQGTDGSALHMGRESDDTPMDVPLHPGAARWYREHGQQG
ncbi:MAG TPA: TAXI family TRAP transporter solute-binding subunit, partial [Xanthobacteraceae bacterium]